MTTKARIAALQWFHDRGEVGSPPSGVMICRMLADGQLNTSEPMFCLTDKGRQDLHEATR